jgi:hypothetical protein
VNFDGHMIHRFFSFDAKACRTSDWDSPNCLAIREGVTPALNAARAAFNIPCVNEQLELWGITLPASGDAICFLTTLYYLDAVRSAPQVTPVCARRKTTTNPANRPHSHSAELVFVIESNFFYVNTARPVLPNNSTAIQPQRIRFLRYPTIRFISDCPLSQ